MLCILTVAPHEAAQAAARSFSLSWIMPILWISLVLQLVHVFLVHPRLLTFFPNASGQSFVNKMCWISVICLAPLSLSAMKQGVAMDASLQRFVTVVGCQGNIAMATLVGQSSFGDWRFPSYNRAIVYGLVGCHGAIGCILVLLEFFVPEK